MPFDTALISREGDVLDDQFDEEMRAYQNTLAKKREPIKKDVVSILYRRLVL